MPLILQERCIDSASNLLRRAGREDLMRERRRKHCAIEVDGRTALLRDQAPLHSGNIALLEGWAYADLVQCLNERVFFWPGTESGPSEYGVRHFRRYASEDVVVLVVRTEAALAAQAPLFCRYNSGSPRCVGGRKSPRGLVTFVSAPDFGGGPGDVVEVTFEGRFVLPREVRVTEVAEWVRR